jgi:uncharacterized membrane protein
MMELFTSSWRTYGAAWQTFVLLGSVYAALLWVPISDTTPDDSQAISVGLITEAILGFVVWVVTTIAVMVTAHRVSEREEIGIGESYTLSIGFFWRYLWTNLLYFLVVLGGMLLFVIPGIIWGIRYVFSPYAVIVEGVSGRDALARSGALTAGKTWQIFGYEFVYGVLFLMAITIPFYIIMFLARNALAETYLRLLELFHSVTYETLFIIFNVLLFKKLRAER